MVILLDFFVFLFIVDIFMILLVLMLNLIFIWGIFWGVGGILFNLNVFSLLLFLVIVCFFLNIWMEIFGWLFVYVVKICDVLVGIFVFCFINLVIIFFVVLILRDSGVILIRRIFLIVLCLLLVKMVVCIVVLYVIVLLGLIDLLSFFLFMKFCSSFWIFGIWVDLLIRIILWILDLFSFVFFNVFFIGFRVFLNKLVYNFLKWVWEILL